MLMFLGSLINFTLKLRAISRRGLSWLDRFLCGDGKVSGNFTTARKSTGKPEYPDQPNKANFRYLVTFSKTWRLCHVTARKISYNNRNN